MNLNDLQFEECVRVVIRETNSLDKLIREKKIVALGDALAKIEESSRKAQWRILELE